MFKDKVVLVTGATGMIGRSVIDQLIGNTKKIVAVSLDAEPAEWKESKYKGQIEFANVDLREFSQCRKIMHGVDLVVHLAGVKGSPKLTHEQPASFFTNTLMFNLNVMESARRAGVEQFLYTSSIGVYAPAKEFFEEDVENSFPSENDKFAGYAKRMGELQVEALEIEYGWKAATIVRPANVYGPNDNFDPATGMVIPSLIGRIASGENPLNVWGDGSAIRDFIYVEDVAKAMLHLLSGKIRGPINLGSGRGRSIKELVLILQKYEPNLTIQWQSDGHVGDNTRVMNINKLMDSGFTPEISLEVGIRKTLDWFKSDRGNTKFRYNAFKEFKNENE
jgi:GDP-L-fucose synthase